MPSTIESKNQMQRLLRHIKFHTGQSEKSEWRRASYRFIWSVPATVEVLEPSDAPGPLYVRTGTISASGIDFLSPRKLKRGQKVLITLEADNSQVQIVGTVVHSTDLFSRDKVGVKFELSDS